MTKKEKAIAIVKECDAWGFVTIAAGVFLESSASMQAQAAGWDEDDPSKAIDFTAYPYWITTDDGQKPIGVDGANDTDLLNIIPLDNKHCISLDNGVTFSDADDLTDDQLTRLWDVIVAYMDDNTREAVHAELAPCSKRDFLRRYLELAADDLII